MKNTLKSMQYGSQGGGVCVTYDLCHIYIYILFFFCWRGKKPAGMMSPHEGLGEMSDE
jgi:hypothetical protein